MLHLEADRVLPLLQRHQQVVEHLLALERDQRQPRPRPVVQEERARLAHLQSRYGRQDPQLHRVLVPRHEHPPLPAHRVPEAVLALGPQHVVAAFHGRHRERLLPALRPGLQLHRQHLDLGPGPVRRRLPPQHPQGHRPPHRLAVRRPGRHVHRDRLARQVHVPRGRHAAPVAPHRQVHAPRSVDPVLGQGRLEAQRALVREAPRLELEARLAFPVRPRRPRPAVR